MKRTIAIAALVGLVVLVPTAAANESSDSTTAPPADTTTTEVPVTTTPTTSTPVTETPTTSTPVVTETPTTSTPTTSTPVTTGIPTTGTEAPCVADCIPVAEGCVGPDCIPTAAGGFTPTVGAGALPFTGIEDMIAPILLALTVVLGGVVAWRWARLRESVAEAAQRARPGAAHREIRSGYAAASRAFGIEQRARQVFTPRVA